MVSVPQDRHQRPDCRQSDDREADDADDPGLGFMCVSSERCTRRSSRGKRLCRVSNHVVDILLDAGYHQLCLIAGYIDGFECLIQIDLHRLLPLLHKIVREYRDMGSGRSGQGPRKRPRQRGVGEPICASQIGGNRASLDSVSPQPCHTWTTRMSSTPTVPIAARSAGLGRARCPSWPVKSLRLTKARGPFGPHPVRRRGRTLGPR